MPPEGNGRYAPTNLRQTYLKTIKTALKYDVQEICG